MSFDRPFLADWIIGMEKSDEPVRIQILKSRNPGIWTKLNQPKFRYITPTAHVWNGFMPYNRPWKDPDQVDEWLVANVGEKGSGWNRGDTGLILIPDRDHALAFRLRWC